ncbi:TetR/AcrR family transcriptional regulator [Saccharomonospora viridis]|jgi:AcrR family transcriptional regulator|uniref:Transcriptional regulator n=2 Tax=Saccharomonospora viridis TaxID=1852 RepID=C7MQ71_SACVD|nr:transcriptional regulator [Saccharomonospora viridis DSM 43017]KHF44287.1 transcriptional regulator [Saccharomonospora viridis]
MLRDNGGAVTNRRERLRAALDRDLRRTARRLLVSGGIDAVTLAAIAREVGITPPAIYRYYKSRDDLIYTLAEDVIGELVGELRAAAAEHPERPDRQLIAMIRAFTGWAAKNRAEYGFVFGVPSPTVDDVYREIAKAWTVKIGGTFGEPYLRLWRQRPFDVPAESELEPALQKQLDSYRALVGLERMPLGAILVFIECWSRMYASMSFDVFGLMSATFTDMTPMHERMCRGVCELLGIEYEPPGKAETGDS